MTNLTLVKMKKILITTQEVTEQGRPDIKIASPDKLIYVEIKQDSPLGYRQIERYTNVLNKSSVIIKHVILLSTFSMELEGKEKPYKHVFWYEVHNWLSNAIIQDSISKYLRGEFNSFLKEKQMTIEKVDWEYMKGMQALVNLMSMIESGIKSINLTIAPRAQGNESIGRYFGGTDYWCGIIYSQPLELQFNIRDKARYDVKFIEDSTYGDILNNREILYFHTKSGRDYVSFL